jgi:thiosulfate/3-mercaptopyruvate sulfurtransferase
VERLAGIDELDSGVLLDARARNRYAGEFEPVDPRPGHIPGAVSVPWAENLDGGGRLRPAAELRARYGDAGPRGAIAYCGSGVTACLDLLAMEIAGIANIALYPGSWSQWANDPSRPARTGLAP